MARKFNGRGYPTKYNGVMFRSRLEATWAAFFDLLEWGWEYEPMDLGTWSPDFMIHGNGKSALVEVKPTSPYEPDKDAIIKINKTLEGKFDYHLIYCGLSPINRHETGVMVEMLTRCRCGDCGNTGTGNWMTREIVKIDEHDKYDLVFGHWGEENKLKSLVCGADMEMNCDPYMGREITKLWRHAKNSVQWLAKRTRF